MFQFTCLSTQWKCRGNETARVTARCVPAGARCDGARDCHDGDDELDCPPATCPPHHFMCGSGTCVPPVWVCDADRDCADGSDEGPACAMNQCARSDFRCASGRCVPREWLCDGEPDCAGGEDERQCPAHKSAPPCDATYFRCPNGRCIPGRWRCDYEDDCGDAADETGCAARACSESEFRCGSGECVRGVLRCSGAPDCADASDELECTARCGPAARPCNDTRHCVLEEWWCDGEPDCADGSDEWSCEALANVVPECGARLHCGGAACQPGAWRCDGRRDCPGGQDEDELTCAHSGCAPPMYRCADHTCLPRDLVCDGFRDCRDGDDEDPIVCERGRRLAGRIGCANGDTLCGDGSCASDASACTPEKDRTCKWNTCSQLCLPKQDNHTCKCAPSYKQRHLPDGTLTCEAAGDKARVLVAEGGVLRLWEPHKHEQVPEPPPDRPAATRVEITAVAVALINGTWWVWWGEAGGRLGRVPASALAHVGELHIIIRNGGSIRGIAVDWVARRLYWTAVSAPEHSAPPVGTVHVAALDGRRRVTLYRREWAEPDDIVIHNETRRVFWSERGAEPGVMSCGLDGSAPRRVVRARVRRVTALALQAPAARLYFVDSYYDTLETVDLRGEQRALLAQFRHRPAGAPVAPHVYVDGVARLRSDNESLGTGIEVFGRACVRAAAWEEWVWCASARGIVRVPARGPVGGRIPLAQRARSPLTAIAIMHPALFPVSADPCDGGDACDGSALCVRSGDAQQQRHACLCPDGLLPTTEYSDKSLKCVISVPNTAAGVNASCPLECGAGTCERTGATGWHCRCPALFAGARCQQYRCAHHCHRHGRCMLDPAPPPLPEDAHPDGLPPLKCLCNPGYEGARCERVAATAVAGSGVGEDACARARCENGALCRRTRFSAHCLCQPGYHGARCEHCTGGPECAVGAVCERTEAGARCRTDICRFFCLNQGVCSVSSVGAVSCACPPQWSGERCQRPACVDAECARPDDTTHTKITTITTTDTASPDRQTSRPVATESVDGCETKGCAHDGRCVSGGGCVCSGPWGGAHCTLYVGHDHACRALACPPRAFCVWGPDVSGSEAGAVRCVCPVGADCSFSSGTAAGSPAVRADGGEASAWAGAWSGAALALAVTVLVTLYLLHRRRRGAFVHARLADNVEIANPMYLAGDDDPDQHQDGAQHFANPVYESMYTQHQQQQQHQQHGVVAEPPHRDEEHAILLRSGSGSPTPTPERSALL